MACEEAYLCHRAREEHVLKLKYAEAAPEAYSFPLTIRHLLDGVLSKAGDQPIVYRDQKTFTYRDFFDRVGRLASLLKNAGAESGMTVAIMDWDSHRYLESYFAIPAMGAVLQTVNIRMTPAQIAYTLKVTQADIVLVHKDFFEIMQSILAELPDIKACIAIMDGDEAALPDWAIGEYEALSAIALPDYPFQDFDENAVATTFFTTGTTGNPKGVCYTHRQLVLHTLAFAGAFGASHASPGLGVGDVYMPLTPLFHVHAWGMPYLATMLGLKQVYPGRYEPAMICKLRDEHRVTYSHCVPTVLRMVIDAARNSNTDLHGWKMTIGGSALTQALCSEARSLGMDVGSGYGMSETGPLIARSALRTPAEHHDDAEAVSTLSGAGINAPLVEMRIVDEEMNTQPHDGKSRGELVLRAPWLTQCYIGDESASRGLWRGGWLHTQDIATIDQQGHLAIRDRLKDVIKTGGEWIDSVHLEELVQSAEGVLEASVVSVPDPKWGERPLAVVVPKANAVLTLETLNVPVMRAIERGELTRYAKLERFEIMAQLPRTSVGKIDKKLIRTRFA
ncbi:MAG: long-chain-fatty-acid--CoA ligase [Sphingomonadaceae bacterium]